MINPYDLGDFSQVAENCQKVSIDDLVRRANKGLKQSLINSQPELSGVKIAFKTSKTRFGGERLWFACPNCSRRVGTIYQDQGKVACRHCLGLRYSKSRYKGMVEDIHPTI